MPLKNPSQLFQEKAAFIREDNHPVIETFNETFDKFKGNVSLIEELKEKVDTLTEEITHKITKSDLETAMFSHLLMVDENIKDIQSKVKGLNKNDLLEFKSSSAHLIELVEDLKINQFPKYKRKIVDTEVKLSEKFKNFQEEVLYHQKISTDELQEKLVDFAEVVDNNFSIFNENIQQTKEYVNETVETYKKLHKILESKAQKENEKLEEYSSTLKSFNDEFILFEENIQNQIKDYEKINDIFDERIKIFENDIHQWKNLAENELQVFKKDAVSDISSLKADIVVFESHNKSLLTKVDILQENIEDFQQDLNTVTNNISGIEIVETEQKKLTEHLTETQKNLEVVERYIQNHHNDLEILKEEVYTEIEKIPVGNLQENIQRLESKIDYIRETYSKIEPETFVKEVIRESFSEPSFTNNQDPLTPLNKNFVTLEQLQQHYRLFINRVQQQLSTLGGGGETRLKYLDDIVGIATNASAYDGKYLKYNHSLGKFEFTSVDITDDSWADGITGPYTNGNVGIGTSIANCELDVIGNVIISGVTTSIGGFVGNLTGTALTTTNIPNLSGDVSSNNTVTTLATVNSNVGTFGGTGAIPVVTVNGKGLVTGVSTVAPNNGTLTLGVSGTGLTGSATFTANQSGVSTFTVTSNATSDNTNSTIVSRNGSGGFSAGIVTATFVGNITGNLNSSGVNTATTLSGTTLTYTTGNFITGVITSISGTNLNYTGISTVTNVRSTTINNTGIGTVTTLNSTTGTITNLSGTNVNVSGIITTTTLNIGADVGVSTTRTTVSTTSATTIDSFSSTVFRSARVQVQITQGTDYQASDVLIIHDGSTADVIEYGSIATNDYLGTFSGTVSGGNCLLRINMNSASSATVKVLSQRITI